MDSLKRLGSTSHLVESLPAPSSLQSSSSGTLMSSQLYHQHESNHENQHHIDMLNISSAISNDRRINNDNDIRSESTSDKENVDNDKIVLESIQSQQHQTQFIYHALSSTNNRHRRSLTGDIGTSNFKRHLMKRYIVKRNFPNNQLSKSSDDMNEDDSNEIELDRIDDGENDDYVKGGGEDEEEEDKDEENSNKNGQHDRLDDDDNESDLVKSKMDVPYWDAYDTVNQLFLEMSKYYLHLNINSFSFKLRLSHASYGIRKGIKF